MLIHYTSFWSTLHYKHDNVHNFIFLIFSLDSPRRMQWTWNLSFKHCRMNKYLVISQGFCCIKTLTKHLHDQCRCVKVFTFSVIINNICQFSSIALTARPKHLYATTNRKSLSKRHFFLFKNKLFQLFWQTTYMMHSLFQLWCAGRFITCISQNQYKDI